MADGNSKDTGDLSKTEQQKLAKQNLMGLMGQVDEVKEKMTENIASVMERGDKLEELQHHSEALSTSAAKLANKTDTMSK